MKNKCEICAVVIGLFAAALLAAQTAPTPTESLVEKARQAAGAGKLAYKLTTPEELREVLGPPETQKTERDGDGEVLSLRYPQVLATFVRIAQEPGFARSVPYTLYGLAARDEQIDIGQNRLIVLRRPEDLSKFDSFWGFAGASLVHLDLREYKALLEEMPFDSRTLWPPRDRLPEGFDPARRLAEGKGPGLGVAGLHAQGIDGHGVGIAIIDQPLLKEHQEYADRLVRYEPVEVEGVDIQMHGAPVSSIAVGAKCGVAPKASLYYWAVPPWKWLDDKPWAEQLEKIVEFNQTLTDRPKIRVVSISLGAFSQRPNFDRWKAAVEKASQNGILVVTCDPTFLRLATLRRNPTGDPNDPNCYKTGRYGAFRAALCVPAGNRTTAGHQGPDVYTYWIEGGMSWAVPYLAGLAALAFQIDPEVSPARIVELWTATATKTPAGPIVNPPEFIDAVRARTNKTIPKSESRDDPTRPVP